MTKEFFATVPMPFAIYTLIVWGVAFIVVLIAVFFVLPPLLRESRQEMREMLAAPQEPERIVTKVALHRPRSFREPAPKGFDARRPYLRAIAGGRQ